MPVLICPKCATPMLEIRRKDITVDVCPKCGGAWLDRGELERLQQAQTANAEHVQNKPSS